MAGSPDSKDLASRRAETDSVNAQTGPFPARRAEVVREVGRHKRERREAFHVPQRERAVLQRLTAAANGAFPREAISADWDPAPPMPHPASPDIAPFAAARRQ